MADLDLENRDPRNINNHLKVTFEDVLAEPDGAHSIDCVWRTSYSCYKFGIGCCYKFMTILCGLCLALCWGCVFACVAFEYIWCLTPMCKVYGLHCAIFKSLMDSITGICCEPCCKACGACFSSIQVTQK